MKKFLITIIVFCLFLCLFCSCEVEIPNASGRNDADIDNGENENPSSGNEGESGNEDPSDGNEGGNENEDPSGGNEGEGGNEDPSDGNEGGNENQDPSDGNEGENEKPTQLLVYELSSDGSYYAVVRMETVNGEIVIPSSYNGKPVKELRWSALYRPESLVSIRIPSSMTEIYYSEFWGTINLESITVDAGNPRYHSAGNCLIETNTKTLIAGCKTSVIPSDGSVTAIGDDAFRGCSTLTDIIIPDTVTKIGIGAFDGCSSLTAIHIPGSVKEIDNYAFWDCEALSSVIISEGVVTLSPNVFWDCVSLKSVTIPSSVTDIGENPFIGCIALESIIVDENNPVYHSAGNCLIETETKTLIAGCKTSVIPSDGSVTKIGYEAFYGCSSLTSIVIPESVEAIDDYAFEGCSSLSSVIISSVDIDIWSDAFDEDCPLFFLMDEELYICYSRSGVIYLCEEYEEEIFIFATLVSSEYGEYSAYEIVIPSYVHGKPVRGIGAGVFQGWDVYVVFFEGTIDEWFYIEKEEGWDESFERGYIVSCER